MPVNNLIQLRRGNFSTWSTQDPVLVSGEPGFDYTNNIIKIGDGANPWLSILPTASSDLYVYARNNTGSGLNKGQAVYIGGALGSNPTLSLAVASGELTSSKTIGLLKQDLADNEFGYVVTQGILEGIDTNSASSAGDTIWLSPTVPGGLVYGTINKPTAPNHMVFLGYVLRKQNNGKVYVNVQNGFELQELHNVAINGVTNQQSLIYNSGNSLWENKTLLSSYISDFNSSVSGLLPVKNIVAGTGVVVSSSAGIYTINSIPSGGGGGSLNNVVEDTSPQLGGNLDLNGYGIEGLSFKTYPTGTIIGSSGWIYQSGQVVRSEGAFSIVGDSQASQFILRGVTTNNTLTTLTNNGNTAILLASNRTYSFNINVVGRCINAYQNAAYKLEGLLYNDDSGASLVGTPIKTILGEDDASWDATVSISGAGNGGSDYLLTQVSGANSKNINWVAKVDLLEVGGVVNGYGEINPLNISNNFIP